MKETKVFSDIQGGSPEESAVRIKELFKINGKGGAVYWGCDQQWYSRWVQRESGCGPTTAASLLFYHQRARGGGPEPTRDGCLALMETFWDYITPTWRGVHSTALFISGAERYAADHGLHVTGAALDIPGDSAQRPALDTVLGFLKDALQNDLPVAFLNHNNGAEKALYSHHWVAVIALIRGAGGNTVEFLDEGTVKRIDIGNWLATTTGGGGFATLRWE